MNNNKNVDRYDPSPSEGPGAASSAVEAYPKDDAPAREAPGGRVVPFNEEITAAKTRLESLVEHFAEEAEALKGRMDALEPRQESLERGDAELAGRATALEALGEGVRAKLETLEANHDRLKGDAVESIRRVTEALRRLDDRVTPLEATPEKLELLNAKLESVDRRLGEWSGQFEARLDAIDEGLEAQDRRTERLAGELHWVAGRVDGIEPRLRGLGVENELLWRSTGRLGDRLTFGHRATAAIAALLLLAVAAVWWLSDRRIEAVDAVVTASAERKTAAVERALTARASRTEERLAAVDVELARVDAALNPRYDPQSRAITLALHDEDAFLARDPSRFTLELMTTRNKAELFQFVRHFQPVMARPVAYVKVREREESRFVLLYGDFATAAEASEALRALPAGLRIYRTAIHANGMLQGRLGG